MWIIDFAKQLQSVKPDLVFVGGLNEVIRGIKSTTNDIDIVVVDLNHLKELGEIVEYTTSFVGSISGKRASMNLNYFIDIFIEDTLPEFDIINGLKCETLESYENHKKIKNAKLHSRKYKIETGNC